MRTTPNQLDDTALRTELAGLLGWYKIAKDARGILTGKLPGVRSMVPLGIPDWSSDPKHTPGLEDSLEQKGLTISYAHNLLIVRRDAGCDDRDVSEAHAEATPHQRCEAALITLREADDES